MEKIVKVGQIEKVWKGYAVHIFIQYKNGERLTIREFAENKKKLNEKIAKRPYEFKIGEFAE